MLTLLLMTSAEAGGWTQPKGAHYLKVWSRTLAGDKGFFADGSVESIGASYLDVAAGVYGEWGLSDAWTAVVSATPLGFSRLTDATIYSASSLVGVRRALLTGDLKLAAEARAGGTPPIGEVSLGYGVGEETGLDSGSAKQWYWQPVVATAQAEAELQAGYGLPWGWVTASAGGRWTSSAELPESILATAGVGRSGERLTLSLNLSALQPLQPIEDAVNVSGAGATGYVGVEPGLSVRLTEHLSLAASAGGVLTAKANAATPSLNLGIEHR